MKHIPFGRFLAAIIFVGIGILLLLVNIGIISMEITEAFVFFYPFIILLVGLKWLIEAIIPSIWKRNWFWGLFFVTLGGLLVADRFDVITFTFGMVWKLWPLVIIYFGLKMLFRIRKNKGFSMVADKKFEDPNWSVEPFDDWKAVADYDFDFTKAFIPDKETEIKLSGWVGDIKVIIPEEVPFMIKGRAKVTSLKIGGYSDDGVGNEIFYKTKEYDSATRKITFLLDFSVLDLRVDRV
ncbi:cell wall-active antibiotics response protein LiaF [Pseudalkalibacillus caeni]|uniref:Cell wall-active antibiotics response LiaF-like C-terminal domain-containing protein n=1 Tax=Exobacillus caeni TaxID=2574798 RepID=A0A5R9F5Q8_9BACL|nr:cell wall-active antibiotics response protein LiaF [Pseudalkalibacillus caeni]TLS38877.1 hypothetical protein FCL54_00750 [Pseudalkalibacillus caeni]